MLDFFPEHTSGQGLLSKKEKMKRLAFYETGVRKYKFTLEGEMGLNVMHSKTITESLWILQVQDIMNDGYIIELITYDVALKECDSEGFSQLFQVTRQFQKLYDEIKVKTDREGKLIKVLNPERLLERWKQIKNETVQYFNAGTNLDDFFAITDEDFSKPDILYKIINEVEFFFIYLQTGGYGQKFNPFTYREIRRDNAFRTGVIEWDMEFMAKYEVKPESPLGKIKVNSKFEPNKKWLEKAYGEMPFIKVEDLKPDFTLNGEYIFDNRSGWIKKAVLNINEIVHPSQLFHKMKYSIEEIS